MTNAADAAVVGSPTHVAPVALGRSALELDGWLAWNEEVWGLRPERVTYGGEGPDQARLEGVLYLDARGRVRMPPRNPYLPFRFHPTPTDRVERIHRQWLALCSEFAEDLRRRGLVDPINLPPGLLDARPLEWLGLRASIRYTYIARLPWPHDAWGSSVRKQVRKATRHGFIAHRSTDWQGIFECLAVTEAAKAFSHHTPVRTLERLDELLGPEHLFGYATTDTRGSMASAIIQLHVPGGTLIAWSQGTKREFLPSGVVQLATSLAMQRAHVAGAVQYDFAGANMPTIASAKADWGLPIVPYLTISQPGARGALKALLRSGRDALPSLRLRRAARERR